MTLDAPTAIGYAPMNRLAGYVPKKELPDFTVIDLETTDTDTFNSDLLAVGIGKTVHKPEEGMKVAQELLASEGIVVAHTNFDLRDLLLRGLTMNPKLQFHDLKVLAFMNGDQQQELDAGTLAKKYLGRSMQKPIHSLKSRVMYDLKKGMGVVEEVDCSSCEGSGEGDGPKGKCRKCKGTKVLTDIPIEDVPWPEMEAYNLQDLREETELYEIIRDQLVEKGFWDKFFLAEEAPLSRILIEMEVAGLPIDEEGARAFLEDADEERQRLAKELQEETGVFNFNLKSGDQVAAYLYEELPEFKLEAEVVGLSQMAGPQRSEERIEHARKLLPGNVTVERAGTKYAYGTQRVEGLGLKPPRKKKTREGKMPKRAPIDAENLILLHGKHPWVIKYLRWKSLQTLCSNYLEQWVESMQEGRLHGRYDQARTETGRIASREPNLQAIPVAMDFNVRTLFCAPMMIGDYSGLDARVAAHFSEDPLMLEIYRDNLDLYGTLAANAWGGPATKENENRGLMKILMLSAQYGSQAKSIGDKIRISGLGDEYANKAEKLLRDMEETLSRMFEWRREIEMQALHDGYVATITGRKRYLPDLYSDEWWRRARAERQCVASMVQGTSADIVRRAMLAIRQEVDPDEARIILQVHDEILFERGPAWNDESFDKIVDLAEKGHERDFHAENGEVLPGFPLLIPMKFGSKLADTWDDKGEAGARGYRRRH